MLTHKQRCQPPLEDQLMTDRTKKINELSGVLQKQKMKVKQLLQNQKQRDQRKRTEPLEVQQFRQPHCKKQCTETYQRICTEIIDIGNRVLPSARRHNRVNEVELEEATIREIQVKNQEGDHEIDYLKSDQYRLYLESITKDEGGTGSLIKKMKEARNHQTYLNSHRSTYSRASPSPSPRQVFGDPAIQHLEDIQKRVFERRIQMDIQLNKEETLILDEKSIQRELQALNTPRSPKKTLTFTPTMKDIHVEIATPQKNKQNTRKNIKIQSKTIEYTLDWTTPPQIKRMLHDQSIHFTKKDKTLSHGYQDQNTYLHSQTNQTVKQSKPVMSHKIFRQKDKSPLKDYQENVVKINKKSKYEGHFAVKETNHKKLPHYFKLYTQSIENSSRQLEDYLGKKDILKENGYKIDFKLECPSSKNRQKYCQKDYFEFCKRQASYSAHTQVSNPYRLKSKVLDSQTTSTVTQSDLASQTPPKLSKLTVVTPSRLKQKSKKQQ